MANWGAFAGGLAAGGMAGWKMGLEMQEAEERREDREGRKKLLGLELAKRQREEDYDVAKRKFIQENFMEPLMQLDENSGQMVLVGHRPREIDPVESGRLWARFEIGQGKYDPERALSLARQFKEAKREKAFEAYDEWRRTGNVDAVASVFNTTGSQMDPATFRIEKGERFGQQYDILKFRTKDGREITLDPIMAGTAKEFAEQMEKGATFKLKEREAEAAERKAAAYEKTAEASAQNARTMERWRASQAAALTDKPLTQRDKNRIEFDMDAIIGKALASEMKEGPDGKTLKVDHPLRDYRTQISGRAAEFLREHEYKISPLAAAQKAMAEVQERVGKLSDEMEAAFKLYDREKNFFGRAGDKAASSLKESVESLRANGYTMDEIKRAAKAHGRKPEEIDAAMKFEKKAPTQAPSASSAMRGTGYASQPGGVRRPAGAQDPIGIFPQ
jgi:hypothetical protein